MRQSVEKMETVTRVGIDPAKMVIQVHAADAARRGITHYGDAISIAPIPPMRLSRHSRSLDSAIDMASPK